jgi:DNA-binding transcriptional LysR family regulator
MWLILEDRQVDLIDDNVDLAIRITDSPPPGLVGRQLLPIDHLLCATPQYLAEHGTPSHPHDLLAHSCIYLGETPGDARWKFKPGRQGSNGWRAWALCGQPHRCALGAVLQHVGIGSLPYFTARHALERDDWCRCCRRGPSSRPTTAGVVAAFAHALPAAEAAGVDRLSGGVHGERADVGQI